MRDRGSLAKNPLGAIDLLKGRRQKSLKVCALGRLHVSVIDLVGRPSKVIGRGSNGLSIAQTASTELPR
jgi:hypothetical protein